MVELFDFYTEQGSSHVGTFSVPLAFDNAADAQCSQLLQQTHPHLIKHGKPLFTIVAQYGEVKFERQRLHNTQTGKTFTPSAILWQTSQRRHITSATRKAACDASQEISYRKATNQLAVLKKATDDRRQQTLVIEYS
jgi:hypothetical protein